MHRNTLILTIFLAILAAIVVGINVSRKPEAPQAPSSSPSPTPAFQVYQDNKCGIRFHYANTYSAIDSTTGGAFISDNTNPKKNLAISCDKALERPKLTKDQIETTAIGTVSATLYKDTESTTSTKVKKIFFRHPTKNLDIFIAGSDGALEEIRSSIEFIN